MSEQQEQGGLIEMPDHLKIQPDAAEPPQAEDTMQTSGGYTNIKSHLPGTRYEPGMPISIDAITDPKTGDPQVPKL